MRKHWQLYYQASAPCHSFLTHTVNIFLPRLLCLAMPASSHTQPCTCMQPFGIFLLPPHVFFSNTLILAWISTINCIYCLLVSANVSIVAPRSSSLVQLADNANAKLSNPCTNWGMSCGSISSTAASSRCPILSFFATPYNPHFLGNFSLAPFFDTHSKMVFDVVPHFVLVKISLPLFTVLLKILQLIHGCEK